MPRRNAVAKAKENRLQSVPLIAFEFQQNVIQNCHQLANILQLLVLSKMSKLRNSRTSNIRAPPSTGNREGGARKKVIRERKDCEYLNIVFLI